jgi:hypothetical protein
MNAHKTVLAYRLERARFSRGNHKCCGDRRLLVVSLMRKIHAKTFGSLVQQSKIGFYLINGKMLQLSG